MPNFAESHGRIYIVDTAPNITQELDPDSYALKVDPAGELYLERIPSFTLPSEVYGDVERMSERIIRSYEDRNGVTGVLLSGEKGSGKTLLGKKVALEMLAKGQPIIAVNIGISGDKFSIFLQKIGKPITLFFDEFEKTYNGEDAQNGLLTLLDGVYPIRMLAILTTNDSSRMTSPMIDRPGRIYYKIDYSGLSYAFIMEYVRRNLVNSDHIEEFSRLAALVELNFDQLKALVEEMNRFNESVRSAVQYLNVSVEPKFSSMRIVSMTHHHFGSIPKGDWHSDLFYGDIDLEPDEYSDDIDFHFTIPNAEGDTYQSLEKKIANDQIHGLDGDKFYTVRQKWGSRLAESYAQPLSAAPRIITFEPEDMKIEVRDGRIVLRNPLGDEVVLERMIASFSKSF